MAKKKKTKRKLNKKIKSHLKEDVKGYEKERKYLKKEISEDRKLSKLLS